MEKEYIPGKGEVESYLKNHNIKYVDRGNNQLLLLPCPFCGGGKGGKDVYASPCYVSADTGRFKCFRGSKCGAGGTFKRLQAMISIRDAGLLTPEIQQGANIDKSLLAKAKIMSSGVANTNNIENTKGEDRKMSVENRQNKQEEKKSETYDISQINGLELTGACKEYMLGRGISEETCRLYNIVNSPEPDKADKYILMPFVDSEGTTVTYAKYRNLYPEADSNGRMQPKEKEVNGKPCFFGLQNLQEDSHTLIITEGLIDCLSLVEAGVREQGYDVVSVPNGLGNKGLTFLDDNDIDLLATYPSVIIFGDSENGKITLVEEFEEKLEREVRVIADYKGKKDANEILTGCGKEILLQLVKESKIYEDSEIKHISGIIGEGDEAVSTDLEHNSVLRPLYRLETERNVKLSFAAADRQGNIDYAQLASLITPKTRAVVCTHASNLTGNMLDIARIANLAHQNGAIMIVDASQSAGCIPIDMQAMGIDVLCFTGHKGLMGPQGTGGLCIMNGIEIRPFKVGGSGVQSYSRTQPEEYPTRLEAGTLNGHGIAGLNAAVRFILDTGVEAIHAHEQKLMRRFYEGVKDIPAVTVYGDFSRDRAAIVALNIADYDSGEISDALSEEYGIATRPGAHCAPRMHIALGTREQGAVRFSFAYYNTEADVDAAIRAVKELAQ